NVAGIQKDREGAADPEFAGWDQYYVIRCGGLRRNGQRGANGADNGEQDLSLHALREHFLNRSLWNKRRTSKRSCLLVLVCSSRWCVDDLLRPIDAQGTVDRRHNVIHHRLLFELPTHVGHFVAVG